jgi:exodeoxyribonuclease VIII
MLPLDKVVTYEYFKEHPELARQGVFVTGMPNDDYHQYEGVSNTGLKQIEQSPKHYHSGVFKHTRAMDIGSAIHAAVLEPEVFKESYTLLPEVADRRKPEYKKAKEVFGEEYVFVSTEVENLRGMYGSIHKNKTAMAIYQEDGYCELSAFVECPRTGALLRARYDWITVSGISLDLKTTEDARPDAFAKSMGNYGYHIQGAFYSYVFHLICGGTDKNPKPLKSFKFLVVEKKSPWGARVYTLDAASKVMGESWFNKSLDTYKRCIESGEWPCYEDNDTELGVNNYEFYKWQAEFNPQPEEGFNE